MNILYIEHYAGSNEYGMEFRPYYFSRNWVKQGHDVTIVAASHSHLRVKNPQVNKDFEESYIDGIRYVWIKTCEYSKNDLKRVRNVAEFLTKLSANAKMLAEKYRPDVVISSSTYPMDTYPSQKICRLSGAKLVHEVHDMWPICPMELYGWSKWNPIIMYIQAAENSFCRNADAIVSIQPCAEQYYLSHGMPKGHFNHIPNGVVKEEWDTALSLPEKYQSVIDAFHAKKMRIICFFGSHTKSYALEYLLRAASACKDAPVGFLFVGDGNIKGELIEAARGLQLDSVAFLDPIPKKYIPALLDSVDGIYIGALHNRMFEYGSCMNKTYDAMMSGKPIIFANDAPNNYILEYDCGYNAIPENVEDLTRCIMEFSNASEEELMQKGHRGKQAVLSSFEYEQLSKDFIDILTKVTDQ